MIERSLHHGCTEMCDFLLCAYKQSFKNASGRLMLRKSIKQLKTNV